MVLPRLGTGALLLRSAGDRGAQRLRAPGGGGWDGAGPCLRPGYGVPYLARRGWQARSSVRRRCWWPHTHICPGRSPRCSQSAGPLWGEGREFAQSGEAQGCSGGSPRAPPGPALVLAGPERQTKELLAGAPWLVSPRPPTPCLAPYHPEHTTVTVKAAGHGAGAS